MGAGDSTNDIAHLLGMLDPWYERNTLSLLNLPANVVCQVQLQSNLNQTQLKSLALMLPNKEHNWCP